MAGIAQRAGGGDSVGTQQASHELSGLPGLSRCDAGWVWKKADARRFYDFGRCIQETFSDEIVKRGKRDEEMECRKDTPRQHHVVIKFFIRSPIFAERSRASQEPR